MQAPSIRHTRRDAGNNVTYHVMAYRRLSDVEVAQSIRLYMSQATVRRRKTRLRNKVITIMTVIGAGVS